MADQYRGTDDLEQGLTGTKSFVTAGRSWSQMLVRILAAMVGLFLLDLLWLLLLAPLLGLDYFGTAEGIQVEGTMAKRPIGFLAYLSMAYALAALTNNWFEGLRIGYIIYSIFDFTSTYMYHGWGYRIALLDCAWGTLLFTIVAAALAEMEKLNVYRRLAD